MINPAIKLRHLQTFVEIARQRSVLRAAEVLHISQPAVTKTIRELEEALTVKVLERDGRGIRLTRQGETFLRHATATLTAFRQGIDSVSQDMADAAPLVRIGALPTVSARIMPRAVNHFLAGEPNVRLKIVTGENGVLLDQLRAGVLDLVVGRLADAERMKGFSFEHLYSERVVLVVRPEHPLLAETAIFPRLGAFPVLVPTQSAIIRPVVDRFLVTNGIDDLPVRIETISDAFGRVFVSNSDAVWIISEGVVANDLATGLLERLPVDTQDTRGPVGLTMRADFAPAWPFTAFMQAIRHAVDEIA